MVSGHHVPPESAAVTFVFPATVISGSRCTLQASSPLHGSRKIEGPHKPLRSLGAASQPEEEEEEGEAEQSEMKGKRHGGRGEAMMEDRLEDMADGPKNAKITLSFPLSAAPLPASLTSPNHCRSSSSSSPSPHRRRPSSKSSDEGSLWKLDATMDEGHKIPASTEVLQTQPSRTVSEPSEILWAGLGGLCNGDGWDGRPKCVASPSQTAQILFSLGTSAYQRGGDAERREKITGRPAGKVGSPHGPSLHPPTLHLPPLATSLLPSEGLTAPHSPPIDSLKPRADLQGCAISSSARPLPPTVHMQRIRQPCPQLPLLWQSVHPQQETAIPRGRLQGAGPTPQQPGPSSSHRVAEGGAAGGGRGDDAAATELVAGDESHFVKVVDANVIYFCSVCERSYMTLSSLKRHSNVHSWRRKYPCHYCDKVFALAEYRRKHEVWHTGERRYQCIFCWDAFATYYNLKTHQKTIHGINPSLISSEKTANGGYKQKASALKLYRLLPMRSQKRPYKTYSDGLHNGLLLPPTETPPLSLPGLGCSLGPGDLQSLISGAHPQSVKPEPDAFPDDFPVSVAPEHRDLSALTPLPQTDVPQWLLQNKEAALDYEEHGRSHGTCDRFSSSPRRRDKHELGHLLEFVCLFCEPLSLEDGWKPPEGPASQAH
ncbi:uncharacterized protein AKAME5_000645400 [Lates japonicus]|uniref:C2H2-type domain-containing protein n=1 Tax=Lates japonicus TaxID=270547 RepID=A0AAD3MH87_LATJO|nr:uncharacterized protein AKAME5_000645400 [Lates japonicus]